MAYYENKSTQSGYFRVICAQHVMNRLLDARLASRLEPSAEVQAPPLTREEMRKIAEQSFDMADEMVKAKDKARCCKECGTEKW